MSRLIYKHAIKYLIIILFTAGLLLASDNSGKTKLNGKIYDSQTLQPLEFANVVIFNDSDSSQSAGTVANSSGEFEINLINTGGYYLKASFIGYKPKFVSDINVEKFGNILDIGDIYLDKDDYNIDAVVITGERSPVSYEIDKKVINVDKQYTAAGGTAVDVLENVPSITVDIEGNVSLRGSGNFKVLVDGRPTILDANELLQQTPASSIKDIEIITNPSAKYDPEGSAGIINLVMKKIERDGLSAMMELTGGLNDKFGGNFLTEYKMKSVDLNLGFDYNDMIYLYDKESVNRTTINGFSSYINSNGDGTWGRKRYNLRAGANFHLSPKSNLIFGFNYGDGGFEQTSNTDFLSWTTSSTAANNYFSEMSRERKGDYYSLSSTFDHKFSNEDHKILLDFQFSKRNGNEETVNRLLSYSENSGDDLITQSGQKSWESGPSYSFDAKLDYSLPLGNDQKFEAGLSSDLSDSDDLSGLSEYDSETGKFIRQNLYSNEVNYKRNVYAVYSLYNGKIDNFGYQAGLRSEYTDRSITLLGTGENFKIDRTDLFPSAHISYKFAGGEQLMASYTKRINRPRGWYLEPFETFMDAYNVRTGNPALKPEYIDSYELGFQALLGKSVFSIETYYKVRDNKIERVRSAYDDDITLQSIENVGADYSLGNEFMYNFDMLDSWNINLMGNLYYYKIEGKLFNEDFSRDSFNWNTRMNNSFKIWSNTNFQLNLMYNSPSVSSQGRDEGYFITDIAIRQDFFEKALSATLQIKNLLSTANWESVYESEGFYNYDMISRESPMVMMTLRYNFNMKPKRDRPGGDNMIDGGGDF